MENILHLSKNPEMKLYKKAILFLIFMFCLVAASYQKMNEYFGVHESKQDQAFFYGPIAAILCIIAVTQFVIGNPFV